MANDVRKVGAMEVVDASQYLGDLSGESRTSSDLQPRRSPDHLTGEDGPEWELVDVVLTGGAPWGFSLRGGLEHQEPLLITKVEEGSRAASAHLQVEDEIVSINGVPLSGYRKEAICLVKSSSKSLTLEIKRSPSDDFKSCLVQTDLQHASCQFSSVANIERTKQSTNKAQSGTGHSVAGRSVHKHKSAYNSFSCGTADQSNSPSSECMFYQGSLSESHRNSQVPVSNGGGASARLEEQTGSRCSSSGKMNLNPVWYIPDKSSAASSPSPPTPSRSDNFTAAQVYEKGSAVPYSQGPPSCSSQKTHSRVTDRRFDDYHVSESGPESRRAYDTLSRKDFLHIHLPAEDYNPNRLKTKKSLSSSTTDVRQLQNPFTCQPQHQRQHSDEVSFHLQPINACAPKTQIVGSYYSTLQSLPSNAGVHYQARSFTASQASAGQEHNPDELAHLRYCCITAQQPTLLISQAKVVEEPRPESDTSKDGSGQKPEKSQRAIKYKYPPPYIQASEINSGNEHFKQTVILCPAEGTSLGPSPAMGKSNSNETEKENPWRKDRGIDENQHSKNILYQQTEQRNLPTIAHGDTLRNPCISRDQHKICPEKTPLLHFLAQESHILANSTMASTNEVTQQETSDPSSGKQGRRSDRYATSLRNEVQEKRAQLQKSRSVASLSCIGESEDADVWKSTETSTSSSDGSFTNTYKDHLKEAQARVLQATSFKRRDLEIPRSESSIKMGSTNSQVPRIGSRKRFPMDKRVHSFSEPEKINEVGVKVKTSHHMAGGSFEDKCKFFEGASRLAFSRPVLKKFPLSITEDISRGKYKLMSFVGEKNRKSKESHGSRGITAGEGKQRLGTFAEYEATWNLQRKLTDGKISSSTSNRRHSDVNIFEPLELNTVRDLEHRNITAHLLSIHTTRVAILPPRYPHHHCLQGPVFEQLLPSENNGPTPQKPAQPREYSSTRPEATCPSNPLKALPNQAHSQNKDSHSLRAPGNGCRSETEQDRSAVLPQVTPQFYSPHWSAEVSVPSAYASSSSSPRDDLQRNMVENKSQPSSVVKKAQICDVQAKSRHYLVHGELPGGPDETSVHQVSLPCSPRQSHLLSCASPHQSPQNGSNSSSSDAQTPVGTPADNAEMMKTSSVPPELSEEDEKRDELARDIMVRDKRLVDILDQRKMKTTMDMMEGIYPDGKHLLEGAQQRRKTSTKQTVRTTQERRVDNRIATPVSLVTSSSYYSTSAPKAELLIKMKDMQEQMKEQDCEDELDLSKKKQELMDSLARKLQVLREARESLQEDMRDNDALGEEVEATVRAVCKPNELDKFCMFVGDLDKVVSLLLSLSGRLARVENALNNLEEGASAEEKHTLTEKRKLLIRQHEDAKELKENLDRRECLVHTILAGYLSKEHLADYQHFVKMKAALIIEQRMLEDRIKLGDEQLKCLKDSLPLDQRLHL
ncbi:hypothetical protein P4O66_000509 [Electrophorus voltai]|uniref:Shroom family member 2 n=1 Tax=Electrophorus voltai TaxID=2609070 RepID=A0AAD8ZH98_9TELE|nr:hypothetical protein P4O66_000509 [Electrophorus voltai]